VLGVKLDQVTVGSTDLARAEQFYLTLGLSLIVRSDHYLRFECGEGDSTFSVDLVASVPADEEVTIYFETEDLDREYERLRRRGLVFEHHPADQPWLWREARLRDPDGHRICLFRAGENRKRPPWRLPAPEGETSP
jgi:catechol 2,3-dioxygenase-like lactoylglutathione lyase family enzyme